MMSGPGGYTKRIATLTTFVVFMNLLRTRYTNLFVRDNYVLEEINKIQSYRKFLDFR